VEKIFSIADRIAAINLLPYPDRTMEALLFLRRPRHRPPAAPITRLHAVFPQTNVSPPRQEFSTCAPSVRCCARPDPGRRLAEIVAIAAASLPAAGA